MSDGKDKVGAIIIRPWPKVIFLYPTFIAALVAGVWQSFLKDPNSPDLDPEAVANVASQIETVGLVFFLVFAFNLLVISFEFSRIKTVAIFFFLLAIVFLALYLTRYLPIAESIKNALRALKLTMSTSFYFAVTVYFLIIYVGVFVITRWNYWEIRHNEIIHHTGFLGDIKRYPSPNLRMTKVINDVFEFLLLGAGRIVLYPASEREAVVLENVLNVNKVENTVKQLLSALKVEVATHGEVHAAEEH